MKKYALIILFLVLGMTGSFLISSCKKENDNQHESFDRSKMLNDYYEYLILPSVTKLKTETDKLALATIYFTEQNTQGSLDSLRQTWLNAYKAYQHCAWLNFGPGENVYGTFIMNTSVFPVDTAAIETIISSQNFAGLNTNKATKGFNAYDYVLFTKADVLKQFEQQNRKTYLLKITEDLQNRMNQFHADWVAYENTFVSNTGTEVGSSTSMMYNAFVQHYEFVKNFKVRLPAGLYQFSEKADNKLCEAYRSGNSGLLLKESVVALRQAWSNNTGSENGIGFEEYIESIENGETLAATMRTKFADIETKLAVTNNDLTIDIAQNPTRVGDLFTSFQKMVTNVKSEMSSYLGLAITFGDADGD
jgi:predicted lipoprotein